MLTRYWLSVLMYTPGMRGFTTGDSKRSGEKEKNARVVSKRGLLSFSAKIGVLSKSAERMHCLTEASGVLLKECVDIWVCSLSGPHGWNCIFIALDLRVPDNRRVFECGRGASVVLLSLR
jgi:hypothetical protein